MNDSLTIEEQIQPFYKFGTYVSAVICIISFLIFWNITSPFWISIFRFGSFIFFAIAVLGYLRLMNRPLTVTLESSDDKLKVFYKKNGKVIQEEEFDRSTVKNVTLEDLKFNFMGSVVKSFRIHFTDTSNKLYLFEFSGRPLFFDQQAIDKTIDFLINKDIKI